MAPSASFGRRRSWRRSCSQPLRRPWRRLSTGGRRWRATRGAPRRARRHGVSKSASVRTLHPCCASDAARVPQCWVAIMSMRGVANCSKTDSIQVVTPICWQPIGPDLLVEYTGEAVCARSRTVVLIFAVLQERCWTGGWRRRCVRCTAGWSGCSTRKTGNRCAARRAAPGAACTLDTNLCLHPG